MKPLVITDLHERHSGLTIALGNVYGEAARVCLARHHKSPVTMNLKHDTRQERRSITFDTPDSTTLRAHSNEIDATEAGAYGVSLAAVEDLKGLVAVRRAETLSGADWYLAPASDNPDDLEDCVRLEVSGLNLGSSADVQRRLREKLDQTTRGKSNLPAIASVVGFRAREIAVSGVRE